MKPEPVVSIIPSTGNIPYGEGDIFLGITVPQSRRIAVKYKKLSLSDIILLLTSKIHEERLIGLLILVHTFITSDENTRKQIFKFYERERSMRIVNVVYCVYL